jgi:hypothetical protein
MSTEVQKKTGTTSVTGTTLTLNVVLTSTVTSGNAVAVSFSFQAASGTATLTSITDNESNVYTINQSVNDTFQVNATIGVVTCFGITNAAKTISITVGNTVSATIRVTATVYEIAGSSAVDVSTHGSSTSSTNPPAISLTTAQASEFAIVSSNVDNSGATFTQNNGWTQDLLSLNTGQLCCSTELSSAGSNSLSMTASPAVDITWSAVTFLPAGAAGPQLQPVQNLGGMVQVMVQ